MDFPYLQSLNLNHLEKTFTSDWESLHSCQQARAKWLVKGPTVTGEQIIKSCTLDKIVLRNGEEISEEMLKTEKSYEIKQPDRTTRLAADNPVKKNAPNPERKSIKNKKY
jgi:hypothetical protein